MSFFDIWRHSKLFYLRVLKNLPDVVFINVIGHYGKFTALYKLISIVLATIDESNQVKISREIMGCQGYFFKNCFEDEVVNFSPVDKGKNLVKHRLSVRELVSPNQRC